MTYEELTEQVSKHKHNITLATSADDIVLELLAIIRLQAERTVTLEEAQESIQIGD